jgi:hypothetical protein
VKFMKIFKWLGEGGGQGSRFKSLGNSVIAKPRTANPLVACVKALT